MRKESGGLRLSSILIVAVIIYGAFVAVKFISVSMMETQLNKEIEDSFGMHRGSDFTEEKAYEVIEDILISKDVIYDEDDPEAINVDISKSTIEWSYKYKVIIDCIFFKKEKEVYYENSMRAFS